MRGKIDYFSSCALTSFACLLRTPRRQSKSMKAWCALVCGCANGPNSSNLGRKTHTPANYLLFINIIIFFERAPTHTLHKYCGVIVHGMCYSARAQIVGVHSFLLLTLIDGTTFIQSCSRLGEWEKRTTTTKLLKWKSGKIMQNVNINRQRRRRRRRWWRWQQHKAASSAAAATAKSSASSTWIRSHMLFFNIRIKCLMMHGGYDAKQHIIYSHSRLPFCRLRIVHKWTTPCQVVY